MSEKQNISCRYSSRARGRLDAYCELTGMKSSEVIKAAIAQFIAPTLAGYERSAAALQNAAPHVREYLDIELTKVNSSCTTKAKKGNSLQHQFGKGFIAKIDNNKFPDRVFKAISENWESIQQSELSGVDMAELYNGYCENVPEGQTPCHPNSWILGGGWNNSEAEKKKDHYDF